MKKLVFSIFILTLSLGAFADPKTQCDTGQVEGKPNDCTPEKVKAAVDDPQDECHDPNYKPPGDEVIIEGEDNK